MFKSHIRKQTVFSAWFIAKQLVFVIALFSINLAAQEYNLPTGSSRLIGTNELHQVVKGDYFQAIAEQYNIGFLALMAANPNIDPFLPTPGTTLTIPKQMLLPFAKREGIVINLPELRLYYFPPGQQKVHVFPVGIGRLGLTTPKLVSYIGEKRENPVWRPTTEMKARYFAEHRVSLPDEVPPGPNNPFGKYALRLATSVYLIHGSNQRFGIGMRSSSGCIRMYDDDIEWLYQHVELGTTVRIIDQAIKLAYEPTQEKLIEVHSPLTRTSKQTADKSASDAVMRFIGQMPENIELLTEQLAKPKGVVLSLKKP